MSWGPEWSEVERPFLDQLVSMGWKVVIGNLDEPSVTGRESFREVLMKQDLRKAIARIKTELLLGGVQVEGLPGWDGGRARTIHFIDWEHPENNTRSSSWEPRQRPAYATLGGTTMGAAHPRWTAQLSGFSGRSSPILLLRGRGERALRSPEGPAGG